MRVTRIFMAREFSKFALNLYNHPDRNATQMAHCLRMMEKPAGDPARFERLWQKDVIV